MKNQDAVFHSEFFERFSVKRLFFPLAIVLISGVLCGSIVTERWELLQGQLSLPLLFSGIPLSESGFLSCFSTILLNTLIGLIILFLLGVTAFGALGVPFFLFCKGATLGIGVLFFLTEDGVEVFWHCAVGYTPAAAASAMLLLLFAVRSLVFSNSLAKAGFSAHQESLDFQFYFRDFLTFLCFSVAISLAGGLLAILCGILF